MNNKLSIICVTYNHENYIAEALESIVKQKTNFNFKVLVGDDASTDKTPEIIKKYASLFPNIIVPILRKENIGAINNSIDLYSRTDTEFVAICDGDDYFFDEDKLQTQVDFLEKNKECSLCFHLVKVINENQDSYQIFPTKKIMEKSFPYSLETLLEQNFIQTNSVVYRWNFCDKNIKDFFPNNIAPGDYFLHLLHAKSGKIGFINKVMSVYRKHQNGIYSGKRKEKIHLKYGIEELNFYIKVNQDISIDKQKYSKKSQDFAKLLLYLFIENDNFIKVKELFKIYPDILSFYLKETSFLFKKRKYPRLLIKILSFFILNKEERHNFRHRYTRTDTF